MDSDNFYKPLLVARALLAGKVLGIVTDGCPALGYYFPRLCSWV